MKYKAGDRVRVKAGLVGNKKYDGLFFSPRMKKYCGKTYTAEKLYDKDYACLEGSGSFVFSEAMLEPAPFGKADLKTGMRVRIRDGRECIVIKDNAVGEDAIVGIGADGGWGCLGNYRENLISESFADLDIVAVYKPMFEAHMLSEFNEEKFTLVWKRDESPVEVTIAEIAELKGVAAERIRIKED